MRERLTARLPWVILAATLTLAVGATTFVWRLRETVTHVRFDNAIESATDRITGRLEIYTSILRGGAALFAASGEVTEDEFRRFARRLEVQARFPGIQGVGWSERVAYSADSVPDERQRIRYLEPLDDRNRAALGFDMYADSTRREAMERARDQGEPAMSGRVTLVQEIRGPRQAGFLLYVPVYGGPDLVPATMAERRRLLRGFVYAPFRADDLFRGIFGTEREPRVSFRVFSGTEPDTAQLLHASRATPISTSLRRDVHLDIAGQPWTVEFYGEPSLAGVTDAVFGLVLVGGFLVTAIIGWLAFAQARARAAAETANRAKSDFLAVMSHELRTPLNAIGGYVELLELGVHGPVNADQQRALERVRRAKDHLLGLINNLLNYARLEAGRVEFHPEPVRVSSLLDAVCDMMLPQAAARELTLRCEPLDDELVVEADPEKAQQVLLNLLSNAVKFTPPGGTITIACEATARDVAIAVRDTGVGIAPQKLDRIFDPFVQLDPSLTRDRGGSGLGLAIARDLSRAMQGDLTVSSAPGQGSTFTFRLPRAESPEVTASRESSTVALS